MTGYDGNQKGFIYVACEPARRDEVISRYLDPIESEDRPLCLGSWIGALRRRDRSDIAKAHAVMIFLTKEFAENSILEEIIELAEETAEEEVIENALLAKAIMAMCGKGTQVPPVAFDSDEAKKSFSSATGIEGDITRFDLAKDHRESLALDYADDKVISLLRYFPDLTTVEIHSGDITTLDELTRCRKLETVALDHDIFPVEIPEDARFDVLLMQ